MGLIVQKWTEKKTKIGYILAQRNREKIKKDDFTKIHGSKYTKESKRYLWEDWQNDLIPFYIRNNIDLKVMAKYRFWNESKETTYWLNEKEKKKEDFKECEKNTNI